MDGEHRRLLVLAGWSFCAAWRSRANRVQAARRVRQQICPGVCGPVESVSAHGLYDRVQCLEKRRSMLRVTSTCTACSDCGEDS